LTRPRTPAYSWHYQHMAASHSPPSALQDDAEALQAAVADLIRVYQFRDRDRICCHNVSVTQCHALEALIDHGPLRLGELSERLWLDKSTTSRVVRTLVRKGYVRQQADASDGRATTLSATAAGRKLCGRIAAELTAQQRELLADFDADVRAGVVDVIRRLARVADSRFRSGGSSAGGGCAPGGCAPDTCR
jgi:MarR family transcriptional regulator, 2-MHQ and catechol-resistance regulon repressor